MKNFIFSLVLFCIPFFAVMPDSVGLEKAISNTYTMYKSEVSVSLWNSVTGGQYTTYAVVIIDEIDGTRAEASNFNDPGEYNQMLSDLGVWSTPSFVIIDEIDGT